MGAIGIAVVPDEGVDGGVQDLVAQVRYPGRGAAKGLISLGELDRIS